MLRHEFHNGVEFGVDVTVQFGPTRRGERVSNTLSRGDHTRAEAHIKKLVDAGEMSNEDAERRLAEMRRAMASGGPRKAVLPVSLRR